ncbi:MAG: tRNA (guanosine(37)-N1)-methyltransferase TrmD [Acidithiobacillus ferriphilus]|uniref:tRNA (guanine-N(1)-)-methyltransferase n=3 Tax=Acidithiobacillaceae TaxID=225058 RepID=A0ABU6FLV7_9PROT|nr:tRNA (guanosine(37)-N1)-methyltransferase TrmD [Acidithiobacillus ferriphilus]MEB8473952.1 tRNA (guanosine(37)-N1)-methyltransferase TrmD [Acidithiobacillus ferriphilus]MEB8487780.1 tRNA (guanosine(37)-N1)-methyltransferase TrmD [Acidithiobacillus ferriphilus]MEB8491371.1 tRNA (guanosine(37)-N1)-methyltransferase TrmD [Acidithiobacillus ferriphilus]MEB8494066.1 tRNA (guanosine(37)-N1)-methyltransferase TrmD [Acidithiobacillus ferriphilus]MEB8513033.1 tRNA (guanosine(37)-N1)-methyltransferas
MASRLVMRFDVITIFPGLIHGYLQEGIVGRALTRGLIEVQTWNPRDFSDSTYRRVDDRPFGGGPGMLMMAPPLLAAIAAARQANPGVPVIYLSPQGRRLQQQAVQDFAVLPGLILLAGRYEGVDERVLAAVDAEWSIGDYVLAGGELPALVLMEAVARQLPGLLGHADSAAEDSFAASGLLDCPHYTRPEVVAGASVPEVLLSGDHGRIRRWRLQQSLGRTAERRPDLLEQRGLQAGEKELLEEYRRQDGETQ